MTAVTFTSLEVQLCLSKSPGYLLWKVSTMGNGMDKILPGLYISNIRDSKDKVQLEANNITHILSIHDNAKQLHADKKYLCINASDTASQDLLQYFHITNDFIHQARIEGGNVLVHCLAGVSRSVTVTIAYIMTVTSLGWRNALKVCRQGRPCCNPNFGFQRQLLNFEHDHLEQERLRLKAAFPPSPYNDQEECEKQLKAYHEWVYKDREESQACAPSTSTNPTDGKDNMYPLAHKAYEDKTKAGEENKANDSTSNKLKLQNEDHINENNTSLSQQEQFEGVKNNVETSMVSNTLAADEVSVKVDELFANN